MMFSAFMDEGVSSKYTFAFEENHDIASGKSRMLVRKKNCM